MRKLLIAMLAGAVLASCTETESGNTTAEKPRSASVPVVHISGAMRNVMHKGELAGTIALDTITNKEHLYGLGPVEYLRGEITLIDGKAYVSRALSDSTMAVEETFDVKAPFFVYSNVDKWHETEVPDSIRSISQLENYLDQTTAHMQRPFAFRIEAHVDSAAIHIVDLPEGSAVHTPEEAHQGQKNYSIADTDVEIIGFFSTEHAGVFIHHDSFVHLHLITADKKRMGHIDELALSKGKVKLYLPEQADIQ